MQQNGVVKKMRIATMKRRQKKKGTNTRSKTHGGRTSPYVNSISRTANQKKKEASFKLS